MIYFLIGINEVGEAYPITTTSNFITVTQNFNTQYMGYVKIQLYLFDVRERRVTLIGEK